LVFVGLEQYCQAHSELSSADLARVVERFVGQ